jgi:hypothetical protein
VSLNSLLRPEILKAHRASWSVWVGDGSAAYPRERIPYQSTMRGTWGYDVECSCGEFDSKTGGATRNSVEDMLWDHRYAAQCELERTEN